VEAIEGGDSLGTDTADTGGGKGGAGEGHALGQEDLSDGVDLNVVVESVLLGQVDLNVHGADQGVVQALDGDLVLAVVDIDDVLAHVGGIEVLDDVLDLVGDVLDNSGDL